MVQVEMYHLEKLNQKISRCNELIRQLHNRVTFLEGNAGVVDALYPSNYKK